MKTYLSPLGFDTSHLISLIVRFGIESEDKVILIRPTQEDDRAERAIEEIKEIGKKIGPNITITVIQVNHRNFQEMVLQFIDIIKASSDVPQRGNTLHVNLSGGPREILIALTTACVTMSDYINSTTYFSDIERELGVLQLPHITIPPDEKEFSLLQDIKKNGPTTLSDIATRLQISESTISRQCSRLIGLRWIKVETRGKNKFVELLSTGEIMIRLYSPTKE